MEKEENNKYQKLFYDSSNPSEGCVLVTIELPINGLVLSPLATKEECEVLYKEWIENYFTDKK